MDAKNINNQPETFGEKMLKFFVVNLVKLIIVGVFNVLFCGFIMMFVFLFQMITELAGYTFNLPIKKTLIICYIITYIFLFWYLVIKNDKSNNNRL